MASTFALLGRAPHCLKYRVTSDGGGGGAATRTQAQMLADSMAGPLRATLAKTYTAGQWEDLVEGDAAAGVRPLLSIYSVPRSSGGSAPLAGARWYNTDSANVLEGALGGASSVVDLEVRFNHSNDQ